MPKCYNLLVEIKAHFPDLLLDPLKRYKIEDLKNIEFEKYGTICFADISGFTPLSEALMRIGPEGSEILNNVLNFHYEKIIKIIKKNNGDVLSFAGDALNIYFEREEEAIKSALEIQEFFREKAETETPAGKFKISIKIGIATGNFKFYVLKEEGFFNPVFEGEAINMAAEAEHHANSGETVHFKNGLFLKAGEEFFQPEDYKKNNHFLGVEFIQPDFLINILHPFFKEALLKDRIKFLNEHKYCVIIFINLSKGNLKEIYGKTAKILKKYQGYFLKVDCGDKGDKFLILFGVPFQIEDPLIKGYDFLIEFKKLSMEENFSFKAGINYAKIFAGFLGCKERCEYTVLGDGVNISARLMQVAEEGEILSLKEMSEKGEDFIFNPKPPIQLKGKKGLFILQELIGRKTFKPAIQFFYGRKKEIEDLKENFSGNKFFLIYGEQGTGKTYFTTHFLDNFIKKPTIYINCTYAEKEIPYNALKKFLNLYFDYKKKNLREILKSIIKEKNLPVLFNLILDEKLKEPEIEPEVKKGIVFNGIFEILKNEIKEEVILFIDNGHNIDFLSFEFFKNFYKIYEDFFIKTIINLRNFEEGFDFSIEIKNFEKEELKNFLKKYLKVPDIPKDFFEKIFKYTKGNPLICKETLNNCFKSGYISIDEEYRDVLKVEPLKEPVFSDNFENLVFLKMEGLSTEEKNLLKILSIYGQKINLKTFDFLKKDIIFIKNLKEFLFLDEKNEILNFIDENYQKVIYDSLEFNFKRQEHLRIGNFLDEKLRDEKERLYLLSYHFGEGEDKKALPYLSEISKEKEKLFDIKGAITYLEKCFKISSKYNFFYEGEILRLSNLYLLSGLPEKAIKILKEKENNFQNKFQFYLNLSNCYKSIGGFKEAIELVKKAKENSMDKFQLFLSRVQEGRTLGQMGRFKEAKKVIEENYKIFKDFKKEKEYYTNLMNLAFFKVQSGNAKEAIVLIEKAIKFFKKSNLFKELITCYINISSIYANFFGDYEQALKYSKRAYILSLKYGFLELEALLKLEHNISDDYLRFGNIKFANNYISKAISKGKYFYSDYSLKLYCIKSQINFYLGNFDNFFENIKISEQIADKIKGTKEQIYELKLYYFYLKNDKKNYFKVLKEYENLIKKEKMENLKPEILNFKAEGEIKFGKPGKFIKKEIENYKFCLNIKNLYEAYRALRFLYLSKEEEKYFKEMKKFQKKLKDRKFKVEFLLFEYLRKQSKKNKEILLKNIKKYPYFDIKLQTYQALSKLEKDKKLRKSYENKFKKLKEKII